MLTSNRQKLATFMVLFVSSQALSEDQTNTERRARVEIEQIPVNEGTIDQVSGVLSVQAERAMDLGPSRWNLGLEGTSFLPWGSTRNSQVGTIALDDFGRSFLWSAALAYRIGEASMFGKEWQYGARVSFGFSHQSIEGMYSSGITEELQLSVYRLGVGGHARWMLSEIQGNPISLDLGADVERTEFLQNSSSFLANAQQTSVSIAPTIGLSSQFRRSVTVRLAVKKPLALDPSSSDGNFSIAPQYVVGLDYNL